MGSCLFGELVAKKNRQSARRSVREKLREYGGRMNDAMLATRAGDVEIGPFLDGRALGLVWSLPFAGLLLSIAAFPLLAPRLWEHHFAKIAGLWALGFVVPCALAFGGMTALTETLHALLLDYFPFIILLFALFVVAGGIRVSGNFIGTPAANTVLLAFGTLSASLIGTTGASMLLIRPLIQANRDRQYKVQTFVFFIFLVCNIGGSLTPLGPPLFLGFLRGVDFQWTMTNMLLPMLLVTGPLLTLFYLLDRSAWGRESAGVRQQTQAPRHVRIEGSHNLLYLVGIVGAVLLGGILDHGITIPVGLKIDMPLSGLARDGLLLVFSYLSWKTTRRPIRVENAFTWIPIQEVAVLFAAIFITMIPLLAMLRAGQEGALASLLSLVSTREGQPAEGAYFWLTGALSSFLDNAPTYLVFFNLAGGNAVALMGPLAGTLIAISAGAVFMGANTYIGNAPNFMVRSICEERGIAMPSFFGYMLWSGGILLPLFALLSLLLMA
jgi:Na+/H+ antiporter NhaD/arsenite permease-like protein